MLYLRTGIRGDAFIQFSSGGHQAASRVYDCRGPKRRHRECDQKQSEAKLSLRRAQVMHRCFNAPVQIETCVEVLDSHRKNQPVGRKQDSDKQRHSRRPGDDGDGCYSGKKRSQTE